MTWRPWLSVVLMVAAACETFDDNTPVCVPAEPAPCYCPTGAPGEKVCQASGLSYGACACRPDAGTDGATDASDGEPDAGPDASPSPDAEPGPP
ncbi:MAG: hypothetical protein HS111_21435 [Kofleriaceae bacterium]|nr:hypothetical protein [Kofleriaceae bacterium]MCL4223158.1 hypothetical protein [Myxococcales bacterium]